MSARFFMKASDAYVAHNTDAQLVCIVGFERGYYPIYTLATPDMLNEPGMTPEVLEAALVGSMFGWGVPGARAAVEYIEAAEAEAAKERA